MIPGEVITAGSDIILNEGAETVTLKVANTGDRPIQVGSHYHFFETNAGLRFDREKARGMRLDIAAGTAVRFEPGQERDVTLVPIGGKRTIYGFRQMIEAKALDYIQFDTNRVGGISAARKIQALAEAHSIPVVPHAGQMHNYHVVMASLNSPIAEYFPQVDVEVGAEQQRRGRRAGRRGGGGVGAAGEQQQREGEGTGGVGHGAMVGAGAGGVNRARREQRLPSRVGVRACRPPWGSAWKRFPRGATGATWSARRSAKAAWPRSSAPT